MIMRMFPYSAGLPARSRPSEKVVPGLLDGLDVIRRRFAAVVASGSGRDLPQAAE